MKVETCLDRYIKNIKKLPDAIKYWKKNIKKTKENIGFSKWSPLNKVKYNINLALEFVYYVFYLLVTKEEK
jgi:hypothetical protein